MVTCKQKLVELWLLTRSLASSLVSPGNQTCLPNGIIDRRHHFTGAQHNILISVAEGGDLGDEETGLLSQPSGVSHQQGLMSLKTSLN